MATAPHSLNCRRCGYPLAAGAPTMGLCPRCLLARVLEVRQNVQAQLDRINPWPDAPSIESLNAALPQLEVLELLACGGMGLVYRARQRNLGREVALKILPLGGGAGAGADVQARFLAEARILAGLNHPNIVMAIEAGQTADGLYLVMEFIHGPDLHDVLKRQGRLDPRHALTIATQTAAALAYAHARQIVHRDVKPANILLDPGDGAGAADANLDAFFAAGGRARLADFGIARPLESAARDITLTAPHQYVGTADYLAPECRQAGHVPGPAGDIYALGVVLYEMLTGRLPAGHFPPPSRVTENAVSKRVDAIVLRCLAADPSDRYASAEDLRRDLDRARASAMAHRWAWRVPVAVAAALVLVAVAVPLVLSTRDPVAKRSGQPVAEPISTAGPASQPATFVLMPGDAVKVELGGQWYNATVLQREGRRVQVHYDGWSSDSDEWVGPDRLKW